MVASLRISKIRQGFYILRKLWILRIFPTLGHPCTIEFVPQHHFLILVVTMVHLGECVPHLLGCFISHPGVGPCGPLFHLGVGDSICMGHTFEQDPFLSSVSIF